VSHDPSHTPAQADFSTHSQGIFMGWLGLGGLIFALLFVAVVLGSAATYGFS
jgi:hypothetical protein